MPVSNRLKLLFIGILLGSVAIHIILPRYRAFRRRSSGSRTGGQQQREEYAALLAQSQAPFTPLGAGECCASYKTESTLAAKTLISTRQARCEQRTVRLEDGVVVDDWVFWDERPHVNVLMRMEDGRFLVFEQHKFALKVSSLAPVGGFLDDNESPLSCAKREVQEETGMRCLHWSALGRFRTSANRGGGNVHSFLATGCKKRTPGNDEGAGERDDLDHEQQDVRLLSREKLQANLLRGRFVEVKWAATVSLALLRLQAEREVDER